MQLPQTTERELSTQIRIRPGDSLLIAGLVRESDEYDSSGPGFNKPIFRTSRSAIVSNTELVFLLKPRVIVYTAEGEGVGPNGVKSSVFNNGGAGSLYNEDVFPSSTLSSDQLNPGLSND